MLTELEIVIAGADMVASTQHTLHYQCHTHCIEHTKVLWYTARLHRHQTTKYQPIKQYQKKICKHINKVACVT